MYGKGKLDFAFVAFYTVVFSFTREFLMQRLLRPMALHFGIRRRNKQSRFMEQAYTAIYFGFLGPLGLYVMSRGPLWFFDTTAMFEGFPHRTHEAVFKAYYLLQAAYWSQQAIVLVLQLEKPRKDFKELVLHHVVTLALIGLSYRFHFANMGIAVYITHDISDFFLAVSLDRCKHATDKLTWSADLEGVQLFGLDHCGALFYSLHWHMDLLAALHQPVHSVGSLHQVPHNRAFRVELGNAAIQVLALAVHHFCPVG